MCGCGRPLPLTVCPSHTTRYPELTSSLNPDEYYTQEDVKEVVRFARERGIRVIPEMDIPYVCMYTVTHWQMVR